jgi:hypothetical protein
MRQWGLDSPANFKRVALEAGFDCTEFAQLIASTPELTQSITKKGAMYPGVRHSQAYIPKMLIC